MTSAALVLTSSPKIVIDLSLSPDDTRTVLNALQPDRAYTTHFHYDHSRFWKAVQEAGPTEFYIPSGEESILTQESTFLEKTFGHHGDPELQNRFMKIADFSPLKRYSTYDGQHQILSGATSLECIKTAGHSPSHMSFYLPGERVMFAGDLGMGQFGPWYGWVSCDLENYVESLLKLKSYPVETLLTSHDGVFSSDIDAAWDSCLSHFINRERSIRNRLDAGRSEDEIVAGGIYFTNKEKVEEPMKSIITIWDRIMLDHHLKTLANGSLENQFPQLSHL